VYQSTPRPNAKVLRKLHERRLIGNFAYKGYLNDLPDLCSPLALFGSPKVALVARAVAVKLSCIAMKLA